MDLLGGHLLSRPSQTNYWREANQIAKAAFSWPGHFVKREG